MKHKKIRFGIFETNSSSSHSISIPNLSSGLECAIETLPKDSLPLSEYIEIKPGFFCSDTEDLIYTDAYNNLGSIFFDKGMFDEAINAWKRMVEIDPNSADAYYNLGNAYDEKGMFYDAVLAWKRALEINPDIMDAHYNLGFVYNRNKMFYKKKWTLLKWHFKNTTIPLKKYNNLKKKLKKVIYKK